MKLIPDVKPDVRVFGFAIGLAFVTTMIFALVPALHTSKLSLTPLLNEPAGSGQGGGIVFIDDRSSNFAAIEFANHERIARRFSSASPR